MEGLVIVVKIILKWILGYKVGSCGMNSSGPGHGPVAGSCEYSRLTSGLHERRGIS
jgi:hypothetical protein